MKTVVVDPARCFGCGHCAWICAFRRGRDFRSEDASIWVEVDLDKRTIFTLTCLQCEHASCQIVCPSNALQRDPVTQAVVVMAEHCIGCQMCISACPFGMMHFDHTRRVAAKCDLCQGDPQCVQFCMAQALRYDDVNRNF